MNSNLTLSQNSGYSYYLNFLEFFKNKFIKLNNSEYDTMQPLFKL